MVFHKESEVAVVVPFYKNILTPDEETSIKHLTQFLGRYEKYAIAPESLTFENSLFTVVRFEDCFFQSVNTYSKLLLSRHFYEKFGNYKYILIYQLDSLVFTDRLLQWCDMDYDYLGAPFPVSKNDRNIGLSRIGNGGLSLRKTESFLKVLDSKRYIEEPVPYLRGLLFTPLPDLYKYNGIKKWIKRMHILRDVRNGVRWYTKNYTLNEDHFWSDRARLFYPDFKIAPVEVGLKFSFECFPRDCFALNNNELPFGCHAWAKWDPDFWKPFLIQ